MDEHGDKLVVIDFYSTNCPPCEKIAPLVLELSSLTEFAAAVVFVKVNVDTNPDTAQHFQVTGWPTFLFIKQGEVQTEIVGGTLAEATLYDWIRLLMPKATTTSTVKEVLDDDSPNTNEADDETM
uniref:Thioredoxin domain-containing protein n=2 Tax=Entomoneis paludosa TaxID=265537 RepID=A0A7S2Y1Z4_9STRA|mmetsp:Transcript_1220/g.2677  ORF Transcript_1220/g.2677 Transcript_1220/m.2677 type:complete len:125 (+) Transcript_1220:363-737(+)|eukprot:CAMPEP_0172443104 /NCGR_PEP_ID=MMETSP1065-20121228/3416_1 /TAXON_ID=265537 /ORGANISM="Amphiprora paludosa, Strain CCMP125" /LENGTH=124 /DNA_ID=CAMNT_0013193207 /DNA_START=186 /DNA_END=560 /DNA_ORIENTATION=+